MPNSPKTKADVEAERAERDAALRSAIVICFVFFFVLCVVFGVVTAN